MKPFPSVGCFLTGAVILFTSTFLWNGELARGQSPTLSPPVRSSGDAPVTLTECEQDMDGCATWTFLGSLGNGQWPSGEITTLSYTIDGNKIVIRRADSTGPSTGLTATYTGTADHDGISGKFESSWPGHWSNRTGNWYAMSALPVSPPRVMHWCSPIHCSTLTLDGGPPFDKPHYGSIASGTGTIITVERWTRDSVILNRSDINPTFRGTAVLRGHLSSDGNSMVNGTIEWTSGNTGTYPFQAAWGMAIDTVPGSDAERNGRTRVPTPACDADCLIRNANTFLDGLELLGRLARLMGSSD
jgi:hypothetical protein